MVASSRCRPARAGLLIPRAAFAGSRRPPHPPNTVTLCFWAGVSPLMADYDTRSGEYPNRIEAKIRGAKNFNKMQEGGDDFGAFCWLFTSIFPPAGHGRHTQAGLSVSISRGAKAPFNFVDPTIVYAWMQAVGLVDDHELSCFRRHHIDMHLDD
jgi:3-methyladenine DNA glycosylase Tag